MDLKCSGPTLAGTLLPPVAGKLVSEAEVPSASPAGLTTRPGWAEAEVLGKSKPPLSAAAIVSRRVGETGAEAVPAEYMGMLDYDSLIKFVLDLERLLRNMPKSLAGRRKGTGGVFKTFVGAEQQRILNPVAGQAYPGTEKGSRAA